MLKFSDIENWTIVRGPGEAERAAGVVGLVGAKADGTMVLPDGSSPVSEGGIPVTAADVLADTAPAAPGTWPALTVHYISTSGAGVDTGTKVVWVPPGHATLPAARGWRFEFYPSSTVV